MAFETRLDPRLVQLSQPTGTNAFGIIGAGLTQFDKQQKDEEVRAFRMDEHRNKVKDDKALVSFNKHLDEGGSKRSWYENGGEFITASGVGAADSLLRTRALDKMRNTKFGLSVAASKQQARIREGRYGLSKKANASLIAKRARGGSTRVATGGGSQAVFNPGAFGTPQSNNTPAPVGNKASKETRSVVKTGTKQGRAVVMYSDGSVEYGN